MLVSSQPKGHTIEEQGKRLHVAHLYDCCAGQFLDNELLHELRCPAVHAGSALIQADNPRPPQQDSSQAQELLLPWVQHKSNVASDIIQCLHYPRRSLSMRLIAPMCPIICLATLKRFARKIKRLNKSFLVHGTPAYTLQVAMKYSVMSPCWPLV